MESEAMNQEKSELSNLMPKTNDEIQKLQIHAQKLQMEYDRVQLQLQFSPHQNLDVLTSVAEAHQHAPLQQAQQQMEFIRNEKEDSAVTTKAADVTVNDNVNAEMKAQVEWLTVALQGKYIELRKLLNENETLKLKFAFDNHCLG